MGVATCRIIIGIINAAGFLIVFERNQCKRNRRPFIVTQRRRFLPHGRVLALCGGSSLVPPLLPPTGFPDGGQVTEGRGKNWNNYIQVPKL
ncbi:hypothetical protein GOBAR_DD07996 [Gossypium barbadense]|nr:hypothetical protein GOBAR_DD07996 [Gossypium barbadense]